MECKTLTIDSSTKSTGFSLFVNGKYKESFLIDLSTHKEVDKRFPLMVKEILNTLNTYKPYIIYIEEAVVVRNADTQRFLMKLQGVIYAWCLYNDCEFNTIRPTEWRKILEFQQGKKIKREELKKQSLAYVKEHLGIEAQEDVAESICIGLAVMKKWEQYNK